VASPMPDEPPVTSATLLDMVVVISSLLYEPHLCAYSQGYGRLGAK
jgi:hypothetical protein